MTPQEVFDTVVAHARAQGCKALVEVRDEDGETDTQCVYRGPDGTRCFVGALIPDNVYHSDMEGKSADTLMRRGLIPSLDELTGEFVRQLQLIHDAWLPHTWEEQFSSFARGWGLVYTPPGAPAC